MRFKPGQKIVCIARGWQVITNSGVAKHGPKFNEIVTVESDSDIINFIHLLEYRYDPTNGKREYWQESRFEPLIEDSVLEKELSEIFIPQKV